MNNEDLFRAIGEADESLIDTDRLRRRPGRALRFAGAAAACLAAGLALFFIIRGTEKAHDGLSAAAEPTALSAEPSPYPTPDFSAWKIVSGTEGVSACPEVTESPYGSAVLAGSLPEELNEAENRDALFSVSITIHSELKESLEELNGQDWPDEVYEEFRQEVERLSSMGIYIDRSTVNEEAFTCGALLVKSQLERFPADSKHWFLIRFTDEAAAEG